MRVELRSVVMASLLAALASSGHAVPVHESKEVAGMRVVFGAEPEPAITDERQGLVWRFRHLQSEEPVANLENLEVSVVFGGVAHGPYTAFGSRREPGTYRTQHIFTAPGTYVARLSFSKPGEEARHDVEFEFRIGDRGRFEIPAPGTTAAAPEEVVAGFHASLASGNRDTALSHLAEDVVVFESGGAEMSRQEYASHHLDGDLRFAGSSRREIVDQSVTWVGDGALVLSRTRTTGSIGDREIDSSGTETMLLRRNADGWSIIHIHWSSRRNQE